MGEFELEDSHAAKPNPKQEVIVQTGVTTPKVSSKWQIKFKTFYSDDADSAGLMRTDFYGSEYPVCCSADF